MPVPVPDETTRWRCTLCGNLTRFDVTRTTKAREYLHVDLSGAAQVDEREVLSERVEQVVCRWCNAVDSVEVVARPSGGADDDGEETVTPPT